MIGVTHEIRKLTDVKTTEDVEIDLRALRKCRSSYMNIQMSVEVKQGNVNYWMSKEELRLDLNEQWVRLCF